MRTTEEAPRHDNRLRPRLAALSEGVRRHSELLWWLHSLYALLLGIGVMWLGSRHYTYLRLAVLHVGFIWLTSLIVPALVDMPGSASPWRRRLRLVLNYVNRNFYQQLLFFLLPIYWASTTLWSPNLLFVALLAVSAILSTLDVVYDRHLSPRRSVSGLFFAFNLFACINVMLPIVWRVSNATALPASASIALAAFLTICFGPRALKRREAWVPAALCALAMVALVYWCRPIVPPAPLRLASVTFGNGFDRRTLQVTPGITELAAGQPVRVYLMTAIYAPLGLQDRVAHRWSIDDRVLYTSPFFTLRGGRAAGFRLWTTHMLKPLAPGSRVRIEVITRAGQLVGRAELRVAEVPEQQAPVR